MNNETKRFILDKIEELRQISIQLILINGCFDKLPQEDIKNFVAMIEGNGFIKRAKSNLEDAIEALTEVVHGKVS